MKTNKVYKMLICTLLCLLFSGCTAPKQEQSDVQPSAPVIEETAADESSQGETTMYTYKTQEIRVQNNDLRIYGVAYVPEKNTKMPLVIFSHEPGNDHKSGERYAKRLAEAGYAAYVFDFCGGTVGGNKSDGSNIRCPS